ncbi:MAG: ABC transporter permease [Butyrivibrio sp.]|uniref:ABC transporter permease n=1 Tax=Butyrivibrio sp. TaxID=28121 RepID=UPI0025F0881F|nr:ABC transporter permease [Butyrivibrio sp.]MCR5772864.1 ABC transporter permease [Butyrivibrio sp.]
MRISEIFRLVWLNLSQNKSKVILTSFGIVVGAATIMLVIAIGTGGKEDVAEQFKNLNAGAIDISYDATSSSSEQEGFGNFGGGGGGMPSGGGGGMPGGGGSGSQNKNTVTLTADDMEEIMTFVPGLTSGTMSYTTSATVDGGELDESTSYTIAGVKYNYADMSNLELAIGSFIEEDDDTYKNKYCVLGYDVAKEVFGSVYDAYDETIYIDDRSYTVIGILSEVGTVASGISPDSAIFVPYETGIKYLTGTQISPTITVIAEDTNQVDTIKANIETVLAESYPNATFTLSDAGTKMEAANQSNRTLTLLLYAMAAIVFVVGGIGIMNVLFVSVKERTNEIGILKAIGCSQKDILLEFLLEASTISLIGSIVGVLCAVGITPIIESFDMTVSLSVFGAVLSLVFGVFTGTVFGFYPAYKASILVPIVALNQE